MKNERLPTPWGLKWLLFVHRRDIKYHILEADFLDNFFSDSIRKSFRMFIVKFLVKIRILSFAVRGILILRNVHKLT